MRRAGLFWLRARAVLTRAAPGIDGGFYFAASHEQFLPQLHVFLQAHPFTQVQVSAFTQPQELFAQRHSFWFAIGFSLVPGALARRHPCRRRCRGGITGVARATPAWTVRGYPLLAYVLPRQPS
ncbi:MAG: hypothetical protein ACJ79W_25015 [Myxococcales bacterium]